MHRPAPCSMQRKMGMMNLAVLKAAGERNFDDRSDCLKHDPMYDSDRLWYVNTFH